MASFKAMVKSGDKRADGTWRVVIRFTHNRKIRYISTSLYVEKKDLTTSFKLKNMRIVDKCDDLIREYRKRIEPLNLEICDVDIDSIVEYLQKKDNSGALSFTSFFEKWFQLNKDKKGIADYNVAMNSFKKYIGRDNIFFSEITIKTLKGFEEYLSDKPRARSVYPIYIKVIFNAAREYYNDEENGMLQIKHSLDKYVPPRQNVAEKRALDAKIIKKIFELPYKSKVKAGAYNRYNLALDCFKMSFCLLGINSADLYHATRIEKNTLIYEREKTKNRRSDKAEIRVRIPHFISDIVNKYRDKDKKFVFEFYKHYSSHKDLNKAINIGLKEIGREVGVDKLQYYAARHSLATIAVNDVKISKYVVNDMLNHTDPALRVTELYIKRDFSEINLANEKVLNFVFKK